MDKDSAFLRNELAPVALPARLAAWAVGRAVGLFLYGNAHAGRPGDRRALGAAGRTEAG